MRDMEINPEMSMAAYMTARLQGHFRDMYKGLPLVKMPEDLRTYQRVIESTKPDVIVELGTHRGGSAIWFADQMHAILGQGRVVTVDTTYCDLSDGRVSFVHGDLRTVFSRVEALIGDGERVMVIDDSAHTLDVTLASLRAYSKLVTKGCMFVVEDTIVDTPFSIWPGVHGAGQAVEAFLAENDRFQRAEGMRPYGVTMHMGGWLEAVS